MNSVYIKKEELNDWIAKYFSKKDLLSIDDLLSCIENLDSEVERLNNKIDDIIKDRDENYRRISQASQYRVEE